MLFRLNRRYNSIALIALLCTTLYYSHRMLQFMYYKYCKFDLFKVIFFEQSPVCMHITNFIGIIEASGHEAVKYTIRGVFRVLERGGGAEMLDASAGEGGTTSYYDAIGAIFSSRRR
jgi:hypothetical protein